MSNFRFCPYLKFPTLQLQTLQLPACLTWYFLQVTCPPCLWEISCIQISERYGMLWKFHFSKFCSTTQGIGFNSSVLFLPQNPYTQNFPWNGRNISSFFFLTQNLNSCVLFDWRFSITSHSHADLLL